MASPEENQPNAMNDLNTAGQPEGAENGISESAPNGIASVIENGDLESPVIQKEFPHLKASFNNGAVDLSEKLDNISLQSGNDSVNSGAFPGNAENSSVNSAEYNSIPENPDGTSLNSASASASSENASLSRNSSTNSQRKDSNDESKHVAKATVSPKLVNGKENAKTPSPSTSKSKLKNPFSFLKKKSPKTKSATDRKDLDKMLAAVHIESLPQLFVTKYLGFRETRGLYGVKYTREPLKDILASMNNMENSTDLPLTQLHISSRGIHVAEHKQNTVKSVPIDAGLVPIDFISYGVQDIHLTRIFTFIVVREMSSRSRKLECHAYLCDSSVSCRKLALSVAMAFQIYAKTLQGKPHKFQVDLRSRTEIGQDLASTCEEPSDDVIDGADFEA